MSKAASELARLKWAKAKREPKVCELCGVAFNGTDMQRFCTPSHQNVAAVRRLRNRRASRPTPADDQDSEAEEG